MKKNIIAIAAVVAAFTMASCSREQLVEPEITPVVGNDIITAFTENNLTKTSLSGDDTKGYEVRWSEGDSFKIGEETFTLIDGEGTTTGKFQGTLPTEDGTYTACYPATYNGTDWPNEQTYTEGNITGSPMKASVTVADGKVSGPLSFKNAGGILRLTVKGTAKIRSIKVNATDLDEIVLGCGSGVTLDNTNGTVFHIAMPEGEYSGVSIAVWTIDFDNCTKKLKEGTQLKIEPSKITTASFTAEFPSPAPVASLTGAFSIAEGKQICFSRGNLYYDDGFKFEAKQCNFHGYDSSSGTWGLFGWSTSATNYGMSTSSDNSTYSEKFVDWGNAIDSDNPWRTLSKDEWQYLFEGRTDADKKYGYGRVYGTYGLIILPDEFTDPMKNNGSGAFVPQISGKDVNGYSLGGNWEAMEAAGAVFLPIAGYRGESDVYGNVDYGMYWSSSADGEEKAYYLDFQVGSLKPAYSVGRHFGLSVRLVSDLYTVTFDMNGKEGTAPESLKVKYGSKITRPSDPTAEGYALKGWYKDMACTDKWNFETDEVTANTTLYAGWAMIPDGALSGLFTVNSSGKQVFFSKGNLQYVKDGSKWLFSPTQYDSSGSDPYYVHENYAEESMQSHFGWGDNTPLRTSTADADYSWPESGDPWGSMIDNEGTWRTLSGGSEDSEWDYLLNTRTMSYDKPRYTSKTGVGLGTWIDAGYYYGIFLYPDNYNGAEIGTEGAPSTWSDINASGIVFLPAAGSREHTYVYTIHTWGSYWTSTPTDENYASSLYFNVLGVNVSSKSSRSDGKSVRLAADCE